MRYLRTAMVAAAALLAALAVVLLIRPGHRQQDGGWRATSELTAGSIAEDVAESAPTRIERTEEGGSEIGVDLTEDVFEVAELQTREKALASLRVPPHPWHTKRVETIAGETIEEVAANLGNVDDWALAASSISGPAPFLLSARYQSSVVVLLVRVRRLLAEGRQEPMKVFPALRSALAEAADRWGQASAVPDFDAAHRIMGATYLLAELGDHDSLPLLLRGYRQSPERKAPVPPAITLYAMHRLVCSYPDEQLTSEARRLREEYLESARGLPEAKVSTVTAWRADYEEADPRIMVFDSRRVLEGQPTMELTLYPHLYLDGAEISGFGGSVPDRTKDLFDRIEKFIRAAYPGEKFD